MYSYDNEYGPCETLQMQISKTDATNIYNINMCGLYNIVLTGFSIHFSTNPTFMNVGIASPQLNANHYVSNTTGPNPQYWSLFFPFTTHNANSMRQKIYFGDRYIQNQIQINIVNADLAGINEPTNFETALLTFEVRRKLK
jgi:hypothetical protein